MLDKYLEWKLNISSYLAWAFLNLTGKTIKWESIGEENFHKLHLQKRGLILVTWHGRMFLPIYYLQNLGIYGIVSPSRDGEYFSRLFCRFGWRTIRGSTRRNGVQALRQAMKVLSKGGVLAITPDGPRGPREEVKPGTVYLARVSGVHIIPVGASCSHRKHLSSWDKALIPLPGGKGIIIFGEPQTVPSGIKVKDVTKFSERLRDAIKELTAEADNRIGQDR